MLENTIDKLDVVDEKYHSFYTEKEGKFELDENLRGEDATALLNAKNHERDARKAAEDRIKEFETKEAEYNLKIAEAAGDKAEVERLKQKALDTQKLAHDNDIAELKKMNHELTIGLTRNSIAAEVYVNQEAWKLTDMESRIKLSEDGKTTYLVNALGETVTREEFINGLREDESMAFAIKGKAGTGGGGGNGGGNGGTHDGKNWSELTMDEKKARIAAKRR